MRAARQAASRQLAAPEYPPVTAAREAMVRRTCVRPFVELEAVNRAVDGGIVAGANVDFDRSRVPKGCASRVGEIVIHNLAGAVLV